jgi:hypothetical protein
MMVTKGGSRMTNDGHEWWVTNGCHNLNNLIWLCRHKWWVTNGSFALHAKYSRSAMGLNRSPPDLMEVIFYSIERIEIMLTFFF